MRFNWFGLSVVMCAVMGVWMATPGAVGKPVAAAEAGTVWGARTCVFDEGLPSVCCCFPHILFGSGTEATSSFADDGAVLAETRPCTCSGTYTFLCGLCTPEPGS